MLIVFTSPAFYNITMFGDIAEQLIRMMGHSGAIPGALGADDIPRALEQLQGAVRSAEQQPAPEQQDEDEEGEEDEDVSLSHRAYPLIEMLKAAAEEKTTIRWYKK